MGNSVTLLGVWNEFAHWVFDTGGKTALTGLVSFRAIQKVLFCHSTQKGVFTTFLKKCLANMGKVSGILVCLILNDHAEDSVLQFMMAAGRWARSSFWVKYLIGNSLLPVSALSKRTDFLWFNESVICSAKFTRQNSANRLYLLFVRFLQKRILSS